MSLTNSLKKRYRAIEARAAGRKVDARPAKIPRQPLTPGRTEEVLARIRQLESTRIDSPLVTVIVAAYNVADYLTDAVQSVLDQTLRQLEIVIVDDHSTDATLEIAAELAEADSRVRVLRTPENSGGPGVPRNIGIREARAAYYTFLDGDDTLELHACKNLLEAAEKTNADLTVGRTVRLTVSTNRTTQWYGALFTERRDNITAEDLPKLLDDSIAAGKLYRRSFTVDADNWLLEGVHYEDLVFTARAYAEAGSITVIPTTVYRWHVYAADERKSITAQKDDVQNLLHRLNALELVDDALDKVGSQILIDQMRQKFLRHDAKIYLNISYQADDDWLLAVSEAIEPRLRKYTEHDWSLLNSYARWVFGSVLTKNLEGVRQAILFSIDRGTLAGRAIEENGNLYWQPTGVAAILPEPGTPEEMLLSIYGDPVLQTPRIGVKPRHEVKSIAIDGDTIDLTGVTDDLGGWFSNSDLSVEFSLRKRPDAYSVPAQRLPGDGLNGITWHARFTVPRTITDQRPQIWDVKVVLRTGSEVCRADVQAPAHVIPSLDDIRVPTLSRYAFSRSYRFTVVKRNQLALQLTRAKGRLRFLDRATGAVVSAVKTAVPKVRKRADTFSFVHLYRQFRRLPIAPKALFCESMLGKSAWDSPRYVAEQARALDPSITVYWTYVGSQPPELPEGFVPVRRWSTEYLFRTATSRYILDNQTLPAFFRKRPEQRYLQTWHGIPLKLMGLDSPEYRYGALTQRQAIVDRARQWDGLVVPNQYFQDTFVRAYDYQGDLIEGGTPRNDVLITATDKRNHYKRKLGLPLDRPTVLYAPTFRAVTSTHTIKPGQAFSLPKWVESLGDKAYLLVRAHYLDRLSVPQAMHPFAINASNFSNVNDLYLAADLLITDYSSAMFDYGLLNRPMVFFVYDVDDYQGAERGTYFDITQEAPGPVARDFDELLTAVQSCLQQPTNKDPRYEGFRRTYCGNDDGLSSRRAARYLLTGLVDDQPAQFAAESINAKNVHQGSER